MFEVKAVTHRKRPILHTILMPWENDWLEAPPLEAAGWRALREASVRTVGGVRHPGKRVLLAPLRRHRQAARRREERAAGAHVAPRPEARGGHRRRRGAHRSHGGGTAMAFRVQPDEDVIIVSGARGKHLDPTLKASRLPRGSLPTTSKMGIDATIPDDVDPAEYELLEYPSWTTSSWRTSCRLSRVLPGVTEIYRYPDSGQAFVGCGQRKAIGLWHSRL